MSFLTLPIRRPVAVAMFFLSIVLVGAVAWQRMPVELLPALAGDRLFVSFGRPGSEAQVIEREILLPLQARVSALPSVSESWGEIRGSSGRFQVRFEPGSDLKVRELELQRIAAALQREQPRGTFISANSFDLSILSSFVMMVHVLGGDGEDLNALFDLVDQLVAPRFAAVSGVSQALTNGGAGRQVTVTVDADRAAALGVTTDAVSRAVGSNVGHLEFLGKLESEAGRMPVMLDGRPAGLRSLGEARVQPDRPVLLRHVSDLSYGSGREERLFRVNGQPAVGLILFQEEGANLVRLGRQLRQRVTGLREELRPLGLDLVIGFDAAKLVDDQIAHLTRLGASGFAIALVVLFLFLRRWRAVAVVAVAVPVSLLAALSALYLLGQSLNLIVLFGLALAVGLLVDNSVVVYEAVHRSLERGADATTAVRTGLRRTVRAIVAASATSAVVFLPLTLIEIDDVMVRSLLNVVALSILLPLAASLMVAVGLVPLLAHRLAAPAALRGLAEARQRRAERGDLIAPDRARLLFGGVVAGALRHPPAWIAGTAVAVILTVIIALPWVTVTSATQEAPEADTVQFATRLSAGQGSIQAASDAMARLERAVLELEGIDTVEAAIQEDSGSLTVQLVDRADRPTGFNADRVRVAVHLAADEVEGLEVLRPGEDEMGGGGGGQAGFGGLLGGSPAEVVLSGPDSEQLETLAENIRARLQSMDEVQFAFMSTRPGMAEIWGRTYPSGLRSVRVDARPGAAGAATGWTRGTADADRLRAAKRPRAAPRGGAQGRPAPARRQPRPRATARPDRGRCGAGHGAGIDAPHAGSADDRAPQRPAGDHGALPPVAQRTCHRSQPGGDRRPDCRSRSVGATPARLHRRDPRAGGGHELVQQDPRACRGAGVSGARHDVRVSHPAGARAAGLAPDVARGQPGRWCSPACRST